MSRIGKLRDLEPNPAIPGTSGEPAFSSDIAVSCKNPITLSENVLNKLANFSDGACFYSCFLTALIQGSIVDYQNLQNTANNLAAKGLTFMRSILTEIDDETLQVINAMWTALYDAGQSGWDELKEQWQGMSFQDTVLSFVKSFLCRYYGPILLAVAQDIVENLKKELYNRHIILGQLGATDLKELRDIIDELMLYDWWLILKDAINRASHFVFNANQDLSSAQAEVMYGASSTKLSTAETNLIAAWRNLSSDDEELFDEYGEQVDPTWRPYSGYTREETISKVTKALEDLKTKLDEMRTKYNCLLRITTRIKLYRSALFGLLALINTSNELKNPATMVTFDIPAANTVITLIQNRLTQMYQDMREVVDGDLRYTAPIKVENWRTEIWAHIFMLRSLSSMPVDLNVNSWLGNINLIHPLQLDTYTLSTQGVIDLNKACNDFAEYDYEHSRLQSFLGSFINILANFTEAASNRANWEQRINILSAELGTASSQDSGAYNALSQYDGYDCEQFRFLVELLTKNGMSGAYKDLMTGRIPQIMELASFAESVSTTLSCLAAHIDTFEDPLNAVDAAFLQNTMDQQEANAAVNARALMSMPSFQFNFLQQIIGKMNKMLEEIDQISLIGNSIC